MFTDRTIGMGASRLTLPRDSSRRLMYLPVNRILPKLTIVFFEHGDEDIPR